MNSTNFSANPHLLRFVVGARGLKACRLSLDVLLRISAVLGIYGSLRVILGSDEGDRQWLSGPHLAWVFDGKLPLELMLSGFDPGLMDVHRYLLSQELGPFWPPNEVDVDFEPYTHADIQWS